MMEQLIADMFQISLPTVSCETITWANYLLLILGKLPLWVSTEKMQSIKPEKLRRYCPNLRVIWTALRLLWQQSLP